jgi:hypothetical protein
VRNLEGNRGHIVEVDMDDSELPYHVQYDDGYQEDISHEDAVLWTNIDLAGVGAGAAARDDKEGKEATAVAAAATAAAAADTAAAAEAAAVVPSSSVPEHAFLPLGSIVRNLEGNRGHIVEVDMDDSELPYLVRYEDKDEEDISHEDAVLWTNINLAAVGAGEEEEELITATQEAEGGGCESESEEEEEEEEEEEGEEEDE